MDGSRTQWHGPITIHDCQLREIPVDLYVAYSP